MSRKQSVLIRIRNKHKKVTQQLSAIKQSETGLQCAKTHDEKSFQTMAVICSL